MPLLSRTYLADKKNVLGVQSLFVLSALTSRHRTVISFHMLRSNNWIIELNDVNKLKRKITPMNFFPSVQRPQFLWGNPLKRPISTWNIKPSYWLLNKHKLVGEQGTSSKKNPDDFWTLTKKRPNVCAKTKRTVCLQTEESRFNSLFHFFSGDRQKNLPMKY